MQLQEPVFFFLLKKPLLMETLKTKLKHSGVPDSPLNTHLLSLIHIVPVYFYEQIMESS